MILASKSPRRRELLSYIVDDFEVVPADIDENYYFNRTFNKSKKETYLERIQEAIEALAYEKANHIYRQRKEEVLASDTLVICQDRIMGKPGDEDEAREMLEFLLGKTHQVVTATALLGPDQNHVFSVVSQVKFIDRDSYSLALVDKYIRDFKPLDKAGSYGIQDRGALFIDSIEGDYYSIIGLSIGKINRILVEK